MRNLWKSSACSLFSILVAFGCSSDDGGGGGDGDGTPHDGGLEDGSSAHPEGGAAGSDAEITGDASTSDGGDSSMPGEMCGALSCNPGQHCVNQGGSPHCVDTTCEQLMCASTERCETHPQGGHVCADNTCQGDVGCKSDSFCNNGLCKADVCTGGARRCDGPNVYECEDNGSADTMHFKCEMLTYFNSMCSEASADEATCTCQDDWDCPAYTVCAVGLCEGTGAAPSCSLPAIPFSSTPPAVELFWGGTMRGPGTSDAHDGTAAKTLAPWYKFPHVVDTPVVADLDDDNGDGLVNELDFPEILFISHQGDNAWANGVVRAIHGGGPRKGADYFARCGDLLWKEGMPAPTGCTNVGDPDGDSGATIAVGDLNNDGLPEIVYTTERITTTTPNTNTFRILDHTGTLLYTSPAYTTLNGQGDTPSIANLDFAGYAEIIIGRNVYMLGEKPGMPGEKPGIEVKRILVGANAKGTNGGTTVSNQLATMACVADVIPSMPGLEIAAGATLYRLPDAIPACATPPCTDVALQTVWNATTVVGNSGRLTGEGYCAVADVWGGNLMMPPGPNNRPDGKPEVVLIDNGDLTILDGATGKIIFDQGLGGGDRGGAPNVDDFDGDGFMEVGSALQNFYIVADLQTSTGAAGACPDWPTVIDRKDQATPSDPPHNRNPPRMPGGTCTQDSQCNAAAVCNKAVGRCVCLHNGWKRDSDDDSSKATSSSVFDFNGDGAAEAIYNDECDFRVYDGISGEVLFSQVSRSRTGIENPVVADVDNDGNAEVVTGANTDTTNRCDDDPGGIPTGPNGLRVWGDPTDTWVSARRIWNEQSYHVTNVTEGGGIPTHEPESWKPWGGRLYNTYRSQPRSFGVAPDLTIVGLGVSSPDVKCGSLSDNIDIAFEIQNIGDLRVGPGVIVSFFGTWNGMEEALKGMNGMPLQVVLQQSLEPGKSTVLKVNFSKTYNAKSTLPTQVRVVVDPTSSMQPNGAERECHEDNNAKTAPVAAGAVRADLTIEIVTVMAECPNVKVQTKVKNVGSATASNVVVRYYAGDPAQGGTMLHDQTLPAPLAPNGESTFTVTLEAPSNRGAFKVFAVVDPDKTVEECDDANNVDSGETEVLCSFVPD